MTSSEITLMFTSIAIIALVFVIITNNTKIVKELSDENNKLRNKNKKLESDIESSKTAKIKDKWRVGATGIHTMSLSNNKGTESEIKFDATFTCEIIEISEYSLKIKPIEVVTTKSELNTPSSKSGLLAFAMDKWVPKADVELIMDAAYHRIIAIQDILSDEE